jgi:hypothetical protein
LIFLEHVQTCSKPKIKHFIGIFMKKLLFLLCVVGSLPIASAQNFTGGYGFTLPPYDSTTQLFLPSFPAFDIDEAHRVTTAGKNFVANGAPIRFWGVNITAAAAFPPKNKAPEIAARMRKMGINLVRFHHLENNWSGTDGCIFNYANGTRSLNPVTLDRLDYFIAELKKNGIYVNMNLNVSRVFQEADGVPGADSLTDFAKGVTLFDPWLQFLQREYAQQLVGHTNPYTGLPLAADPVLAMMEMNNENTLYGYWKQESLRHFSKGGALLQRHVVLLDSLWQHWLLDKYGTANALAAAWNVGIIPPGTGELLQNSGFETGVGSPWNLELHSTAQATVTTSTNNPLAGTRCAVLQVNAVSGTDWHIQFKNTGFSLQKDSVYVVKINARAATNMPFSVTLMRDNAPYNWYGGATFTATPQWQEFTFSIIAPEDNLGFGRLSISPMQNTGTLFLDALSVAPPSVTGLDAGENWGAIRRIDFGERFSYSLPRATDMAAFYQYLQKKHFDDLRAYLKNELGVEAAITGTNALVGPADASLHEDLDYMDDHSYWDHPAFPGAAWDAANWSINNTPVVRSEQLNSVSAALSGLALADKPFTVSEYNHGAPNRFRTEMPHAILAYGAFHGMDAVMFFDYNSNNDWETDVVNGFFQIHRDHSVMGLFPSCAYAFRRGFIREDTNPVLVQYSQKGVNELCRSDDQGRWGRFVPYDLTLQLTNAVQTVSYEAAETTNWDNLPAPGTNPFTTASGQTTFDRDKGIVQTATPYFAAITGFLTQNAAVQSGDLSLLQADDFGSVTWVTLNDQPLSVAHRSLLTIASKQQNTNTQWNGTTTVNAAWGSSPTRQDALQLTLELNILADSIRLFPLNNKGQQGMPTVYLPNANGRFTLLLNQNTINHQTMWWGIEAMGGSVGTQEVASAIPLLVYPNPTRNGLFNLSFSLETADETRVQVSDEQGRVVAQFPATPRSAGAHQVQYALPMLPAGVYTVELSTGRGGRGSHALVVVH